MKFDKTKVDSGEVYPVKDKFIKLANGLVSLITEGITCFQDIDPYNDLGYGEPIPYAYPEHSGIDLRASVGTPVKAESDLTLTKGRDSWGNYVIIDGFKFRHMNELPTKTSFKKGEVVFKTGDDCTEYPHLHCGKNVDVFANAVEGKGKTVVFQSDCDDNGIVGVYSDDQCTKKKAEIKPCKFGDLTYNVLAENTTNGGKRVKIKTQDFGEVWATITTKAGQKLAGRDIK